MYVECVKTVLQPCCVCRPAVIQGYLVVCLGGLAVLAAALGGGVLLHLQSFPFCDCTEPGPSWGNVITMLPAGMGDVVCVVL
jgi:hypothetical protein